MKTGIELIAEERKRQIEQLGWDAEHDAKHTHHELARAAACYATPGYIRKLHITDNGTPFGWPFSKDWWKPCPQDRKRELVKAGALIAAEIDRLQAGTEKEEANETAFEHRILGRVDISSCCD